MQQFVVGAGPETFRYLEIIEKKDKRSESFLHDAGSLDLCHKIYL